MRLHIWTHKFYRLLEDVSPGLVVADLDSEREKRGAETAGHLLLTQSAKIHDSTGMELKNRGRLCEEIVGQPCWPGITLLWEILQTTLVQDPHPPNPPLTPILDKNNSLHSSLHRIICEVWKDFIEYLRRCPKYLIRELYCGESANQSLIQTSKPGKIEKNHMKRMERESIQDIMAV